MTSTTAATKELSDVENMPTKINVPVKIVERKNRGNKKLAFAGTALACLSFPFTYFVVHNLAASPARSELDVIFNTGIDTHKINTPMKGRTFKELAQANVGEDISVEIIGMGGNMTAPVTFSDVATITGKTVSDGATDAQLAFQQLMSSNESKMIVFNMDEPVHLFGKQVTSVSCFVRNGEFYDCEYHESDVELASRRKLCWFMCGWTVNINIGCFPGDAEVYTPDGPKRMKDLKISDEVLTRNGFSPVYLFGHYDPSAISKMVRIETDLGHSLSLTEDHYMPFTNGTHALAKGLQVGDSVWGLADSHKVVESKIVKVDTSVEIGLFNPYPHAGELIVNGVLASAHSSWMLEGVLAETHIPGAYDAIFSPVRLLHRAFPEWLQRFSDKVKGAGSLDEKGAFGIAHAAITTVM